MSNYGAKTTLTAAGTSIGASSVDEINCNDFVYLLIHYYCDTGWDRAGNIIVLGSVYSGGTFVIADDSIENSTFAVATTDDTGYTGAGQFYVVEATAPYIKVVWTNTTGGATGNCNITITPFKKNRS